MLKFFSLHLKPNGCLLFNSGNSYAETYGEMKGQDFYHASLDPEEYITLLAQNGFNLMLNKISDADCGSRTVWLAQKID